jgi:hypothetical protein
MEIINKRGEINLNKWVEKMKDSCGFVRWGWRVCLELITYYSSVLPYMSKGLCAM